MDNSARLRAKTHENYRLYYQEKKRPPKIGGLSPFFGGVFCPVYGLVRRKNFAGCGGGKTSPPDARGDPREQSPSERSERHNRHAQKRPDGRGRDPRAGSPFPRVRAGGGQPGGRGAEARGRRATEDGAAARREQKAVGAPLPRLRPGGDPGARTRRAREARRASRQQRQHKTSERSERREAAQTASGQVRAYKPRKRPRRARARTQACGKASRRAQPSAKRKAPGIILGASCLYCILRVSAAVVTHDRVCAIPFARLTRLFCALAALIAQVIIRQHA